MTLCGTDTWACTLPFLVQDRDTVFCQILPPSMVMRAQGRISRIGSIPAHLSPIKIANKLRLGHTAVLLPGKLRQVFQALRSRKLGAA